MRQPRVSKLKPKMPEVEKPILPDRFNICGYGKWSKITKPGAKVY